MSLFGPEADKHANRIYKYTDQINQFHSIAYDDTRTAHSWLNSEHKSQHLTRVFNPSGPMIDASSEPIYNPDGTLKFLTQS